MSGLAMTAAKEFGDVIADVRSDLVARLSAGGGKWVFGIHVSFLLALLVIASAPVLDWDSLAFHLSVPGEVVGTGVLGVPPDNLHVSLIGSEHFLYVLLFQAGALYGPIFLNVLVLGAVAMLIWDVAEMLFGRVAGALASTLSWSITGLLLTGTSARVEPVMVLGVVVAHGLVLGSRHFNRSALLVVAGLTAGIASSVKLQAIPFLLGVLAVAAWYALASTSRRDWVRSLFLGVAAGVVVYVPWIVKNGVLLKEPFYPVLGRPRPDPWMVEKLGASSDRMSVFSVLLNARRPFNLWTWVTAPGALTVEASGRYQGFAPPLALTSLLGIFTGSRQSIVALIGPSVMHVGLVYLVSPSTNLRYLLPAFPGLIIAAAVGTLFLARKVVVGRKILVSSVAAVSLLMSAWWIADQLIQGGDLLLRVGIESRDAWLDRTENVELARLTDAASFVDSEVGNGRTLLLFEAREAAFRSDVYQDVRSKNWPTLVDLLGDSCLATSVATHVLVHDETLDYLVSRGLDEAIVRWDEFSLFADRCLDVIGERAGYTLYRVLPG